MRSHPPPVLEGTSPTAKSEASLGSPSGPLSLRGDDTASSLGSPGERGWDTSFNSSDSSPRLLGGRSNGYGPGDARAPPRASAFRETRARAIPEDAARAKRLARARDDSLDGPSTPLSSLRLCDRYYAVLRGDRHPHPPAPHLPDAATSTALAAYSPASATRRAAAAFAAAHVPRPAPGVLAPCAFNRAPDDDESFRSFAAAPPAPPRRAHPRAPPGTATRTPRTALALARGRHGTKQNRGLRPTPPASPRISSTRAGLRPGQAPGPRARRMQRAEAPTTPRGVATRDVEAWGLSAERKADARRSALAAELVALRAVAASA